MNPEESQDTQSYSPAAVLNLFNNAISLKQTQRIIQLKGIYIAGKGAFYNGSYYDTMRDESSDAQLTLVVPALIRATLQQNKTITINGYITRRVVNNASRIDIQLNVTELVGQTQNKYSDEEIKRIELLQTKAAAGFRDVSAFIKEKIIRQEAFRIGIIIGKSAIIDQDIKHQLRESLAFYQLDFYRVNLTSEQDIIAAFNTLENKATDIIVVSRGGGENLEVFNKIRIAEKAIALQPLLLTAIGHKEDVTLLQQVADKAFITPSELGQFLNDTYNHTTEELENSKAQLVESVKQQLSAQYRKELDNQKQQIVDLEKVYAERIINVQQFESEKQNLLNDQLNSYKAQLSDLQNRKPINWIAVIIAILAGLALGYLLKPR